MHSLNVADALLSRQWCFSPRLAVLIQLIIFWYVAIFAFCLVFHWFAEDVVCVDVDHDHVATLRGEWESACLVRMNGVGKILNLDENIVMSLDVSWQLFCSWLDFYLLFSCYDMFQSPLLG